MRKKFCPKCGKETNEFYENLCKNCFLEKFSSLEKIPKKILIKECKFCGKYFYKKILKENVESLIEAILSEILEKGKIESINYRIFENKLKMEIETKIRGLKKAEEFLSELIIKQSICNICQMKEKGYAQAIIQLRCSDKILPKIEEDIRREVEILNKFDLLAFISKIEKEKNGLNFYIGSKKSAREIAKILKRKYKAEVKFSRKLVGFERGKKVYRDTILIKISD